MQAILCKAIYIVAATDLRVPRRYFVQNLQRYWFVQYIISAMAGARLNLSPHGRLVFDNRNLGNFQMSA